MKTKKNSIVISLTFYFTSCLILLFPMSQAHSLPEFNPSFYLEGDVGYRSLRFDDGLGGEVFESSFPQAGFIIGMKFWEYFGLELGYERTRREGNTALIGGNQRVLGRLIPPAGSESHVSEAGIQGQFLNFVAFLPTHPMSMFDILFGIGIVHSKLLNNDVIVGVNNMTLNNPIPRTFNTKQTHARVFGGLQKLFKVQNANYIKNAGVRLMVIWENTNVFKSEPALQIQDAFVTAKNSYIVTFGLVVES